MINMEIPQEFKDLVMEMRNAYTYPNFIADMDAVKTWYRMLGDIPIDILKVAVGKYIATNETPPTIAGLRKLAVAEVKPLEDWSVGYEVFKKATRKFGYTQEEAALASMDELTRITVRRLGWRELCMSENEMADRANFRTVYEQVRREKSEHYAIPRSLRLNHSDVERLEGGENAKRKSEIRA